MKTLRRLNETEQRTLTEALNTLINTTPVGWKTRWAAQAMLDQKMVENFFWAQE